MKNKEVCLDQQTSLNYCLTADLHILKDQLKRDVEKH